jgi:hypothetical protein
MESVKELLTLCKNDDERIVVLTEAVHVLLEENQFLAQKRKHDDDEEEEFVPNKTNRTFRIYGEESIQKVESDDINKIIELPKKK